MARTALTGVHTPATAKRAGVRRRWPWVAVLVTLIVATVVTTRWTRTSSVAITPYDGAPPHLGVPTGYRITYRVRTTGAPVSTEDVSVRRPFETFDEQRTKGKTFLTMVARLGEQTFRSGAAGTSLVYTPLSPARRDVRLDTVLRDAIRTKRLRLVGMATVVGRKCWVFRSAAALQSGPLARLGSKSWVDSCIDKDGLLLLERTVKRGKTTTERQAVSVAIGDAASKADYTMHAHATPANQGGGAMRALTLDSRPSDGPFWDIPRPPAGYRHTARYVLVPSQPQAYADPGSMTATGFPQSLVASIDDVYVRGPDAVVIEQGSTVNDSKFSPPDGGRDVDLGGVLGHGQLLLSASGSEVVAEPHDGTRFVRVVGTLPPDELIALARSMTLQPLGEMRPL